MATLLAMTTNNMENKIKVITFELNKPGLKELVIPLTETGEQIEIWGLVDAHEQGDYRVRVVTNHIAVNTFCRVVIKGISMGGARVSIDGMVKIEKGAEKTDSFLEMRMLLLDKKSTATVEPKLEIENNNVKASHAASVGKIDEEELLYLKSRGIAADEAKQLIVNGFLNEVKEKINSKMNYV